jgi:hypothetical protein
MFRTRFDEGPHECDVGSLADFWIPSGVCRQDQRLGILSCGFGLAGERALVDLEVVCTQEADVGWHAIAYRKGDEITRNEDVGEFCALSAVSDGSSSVAAIDTVFILKHT